jgi:YgiT-type zinc finger domain-containing protein
MKNSKKTKQSAIVNDPATCPECNVGHLKRQNVAYFTWMGDELISVPDFPAWVCDICGAREYDAQALNWLAVVLNPHAGKPMRASSKRMNNSMDATSGGVHPISGK